MGPWVSKYLLQQTLETEVSSEKQAALSFVIDFIIMMICKMLARFEDFAVL